MVEVTEPTRDELALQLEAARSDARIMQLQLDELLRLLLDMIDKLTRLVAAIDHLG